MSDDYEPTLKRGPGRPKSPLPDAQDLKDLAREDRKEVVAVQRRRRSGMGLDRTRKLYVPEEFKDTEFEYRWINDSHGRIESKTVQDDWDVVKKTKDGKEMDYRVPVDTFNRTGQPMYAYLCRKPKDLYKQDKAEEQKVIDDQEEAMRGGPPPDPKGGNKESSTTYVPGGRNIIGRS